MLNKALVSSSFWKMAISNIRYVKLISVIIPLGIMAIIVVSYFFQYVQLRQGYAIYDPVLDAFGPYNLNIWIQYLTFFSVTVGISSCFAYPCSLARMFYAIIVIAIIRIIALYLVPLEPPLTIIPLRDEFLESFIYQNQVITKDLFFSGHTSNVVLLALLTPFKQIRKILFYIAPVLGVLLILQHVHYSYDVIAAPFFAYLAFRISDKLFRFSNESIGINKVI